VGSDRWYVALEGGSAGEYDSDGEVAEREGGRGGIGELGVYGGEEVKEKVASDEWRVRRRKHKPKTYPLKSEVGHAKEGRKR
jgi:hypothetical protein